MSAIRIVEDIQVFAKAMNSHLWVDWIEVDNDTFDLALSNQNWVRSTFCNCQYYYEKSTRENMAAHVFQPRISYWLNPKFFDVEDVNTAHFAA